MLLIYTPINTARLSYIAEVLFSSVVKVDYVITNNIHELTSHTGPKINYSNSPVTQNEVWVQPHTLLLENNIKPQTAEYFEWHGLKAFFKTGGDVPFDIFAAAFFLVTRYEEYLPHTKDEYGRYAHTNSLAFKESFLNQPLVNLWMKECTKVITVKFPSFAINNASFKFLPTYDIDIAYAYRGKGTLRNLGGFYKNILTGKLNNAIERANVNKGLVKDPFDTYAWLDELHKQHRLQPIYFFLLAARAKLYDKNINPQSNLMQALVKQQAAKYDTGIHPSWQSGDNVTLVTSEINTLQNITGKPVTLSRQHYIRMALPHTYRLLIENGIKEDYSMGYGSINGFRASVASAFYWYDVEKETKTSLLIHPYCYMEANSHFEQHYSAQQAAGELQQYYDAVKAIGGQLITIFHNHFVTEQPQWQPLRNMYADFLRKNC